MVPSYIFANNVMEKLAETNELLQVREENIRRMVNLRQSYDLDDPKFTEEVYLARKQMLEVFEQIVLNSKLVPPMVENFREFILRTKPEEQFIEERAVWADTTCLTNMVALMNSDYDTVMKLDTNFSLFWIVKLVCLNSLYFMLGLRANILISGDAGRGKSYVFKMLEKLFTPGAIFSVSHQTANAHNTNQGMMDTIEYQDE
jgi:hypothetical protein